MFAPQLVRRQGFALSAKVGPRRHAPPRERPSQALPAVGISPVRRRAQTPSCSGIPVHDARLGLCRRRCTTLQA